MANRIVFLNNEKTHKEGFDRQRNVKGNNAAKGDVENDEEELPKIIAEFQKDRLRVNRANFYTRRKRRANSRTIKLPSYLDFVRIQFFKIFDASMDRDFTARYGISPVEYFDFNKTVLFQIDDERKFELFLDHVAIVINSPEKTNYRGQQYGLIALIYRFEFFDSRSRILTYNGNGVLLSLVTTYLRKVYNTQKETLFQFLDENGVSYSYRDGSPDIIEIKAITRDLIKVLANNFDIVKAITTSRTERIRPSIAGPVREYGFDVSIPDYLTTVGVIDTGISKIEPLKDLIMDESYNHTVHAPFWDEVGHGTLVSGLIALGDDFYTSDTVNHQAKARLFNIKALHFSNDDLDVPKLIDDIRNAKREFGIRIFNMSLVIPNAKKYNATYSQFAYELDKLAFEEDVLIFLSVGNFDSESLEAILAESDHPDHEYPYFFYSPGSDSDSHRCEDTNICVPSESLNNISVGALAGNFDETDSSDLTPVSFYPAYYSRKFHFDYSQQVNKSDIKQKNAYLNKPDFVMNGGDLLEYNSGMQILRSPMADKEKFYGRTCGTSLATPLIASYAAEILNMYPNIRTQSVKAILINSATYYDHNKLIHFKDHSGQLLKSLVGFGQPQKERLTSTDSNSIQYLIEDSIKVNEILKIPINLPRYMLANNNKLQFDVALSFSFLPVKDNHLDYLPLHIAFNIVRDVDIEDVAKKQNSYSIKSVFSWSEDHFGIDNRLFSNAQKKSYRLQPADINACNGSVGIAVRCLAKNSYLGILQKEDHKFSITIRVTEIISNENESGVEFYNEMMAINNYNDISAVLDSDLEALL